MFAHQVFHIQPGGIGAFGESILSLVDLVVENFQTDVGNPDIVNIGKDQRHFGLCLVPILTNAVEFATNISPRLLYL